MIGKLADSSFFKFDLDTLPLFSVFYEMRFIAPLSFDLVNFGRFFALSSLTARTYA
jgi:hypothetical protein